ncbi:hypothetical protein ABTM58_21145, partial [Acinetobacter baumannii]
TENADRFAATDIDAHAVYDLARAETFFDAMNRQITGMLRTRRGSVRGCAAARRILARLLS